MLKSLVFALLISVAVVNSYPESSEHDDDGDEDSTELRFGGFGRSYPSNYGYGGNQYPSQYGGGSSFAKADASASGYGESAASADSGAQNGFAQSNAQASAQGGGQYNPYNQPNQYNPYNQPNQYNPYNQPNQYNPYNQPNQQYNPYGNQGCNTGFGSPSSGLASANSGGGGYAGSSAASATASASGGLSSASASASASSGGERRGLLSPILGFLGLRSGLGEEDDGNNSTVVPADASEDRAEPSPAEHSEPATFEGKLIVD